MCEIKSINKLFKKRNRNEFMSKIVQHPKKNSIVEENETKRNKMNEHNKNTLLYPNGSEAAPKN